MATILHGGVATGDLRLPLNLQRPDYLQGCTGYAGVRCPGDLRIDVSDALDQLDTLVCFQLNRCIAASNKGIATSNKGITTSNKKLLVTLGSFYCQDQGCRSLKLGVSCFPSQDLCKGEQFLVKLGTKLNEDTITIALAALASVNHQHEYQLQCLVDTAVASSLQGSRQ